MQNRLLEKDTSAKTPRWEFAFLSGLTGEPAGRFYKVVPENTASTCKKCSEMGNQLFLIREAVKGKNFPPFHPHCRCTAVDKDGKRVVLWEDRYIGTMQQCYGFTEEESELILQAYRLLSNEAKRLGLSRQQQIHHVFSKMAALCDAYSGENFIFRAAARHPSTEEAKLHLIALGMGENDTEALYKAIMRQYYSQIDEIDFAHELAVISIAAEDFIINNTVDALFADLTAVGSYKGDVFSASMPPDDMNADVDGTNVYNRMLSGNKGFFDILIEYNEGVKDGTINRVDEFLRFYGDGDTKKGLQYIKDDLLNVDMASHYLSETYYKIPDDTWEKIKETTGLDSEIIRKIPGYGLETAGDLFIKTLLLLPGVNFINKVSGADLLSKTNANRSFEESKAYAESKEGKEKNVKSITEVSEAFIKYLEEGMSK